MHPSTAALLRYFDFDHLPPELQEVSRPFHDLAHKVAAETSGAETTTGLRKLLEAKDCIVRAYLTERRDIEAENEAKVAAQPTPPDEGLAQARQTQPEA